MNAEQLIQFEKEIAELYESGQIKAPVHLRDGNEQALCDIFKSIREQDFAFCSWASHLHCLLKGVPPERVKQDILEGRSITLNYPEYNLFSSAIVGGTASIATGTAW
jgi:TPP-dependent pyruvate/acetoin dehydrogenase alpha subunit